jgi:signal transduction histidine kinase
MEPMPPETAPLARSPLLDALDSAVRGIAAELDLDRVLQGIVDRVRELVAADYAALGLVDERGLIELFITSGVSQNERERIGDPPRGHGLLGLIIREGRSFRIDDIATDPRRHGLPPNHPEMHPFLGVPVRARQTTVGNLYLANGERGRLFTDADQELVERFALHAGIAIENARLHDRVQRLTVVEERERIGRELHDSIIQRLYGLTLSLDDVPELVSDDPHEARRRVDQAIDTLSATIGEIRTFIFGLQPVDVAEGGIVGALQQMAAEMGRNVGLEVSLETEFPADPPMVLTAELLSVVREALTNVSRHAEATSAVVALIDDEDGWRLEVADNGRGFDARAPGTPGHHGIANMHERAKKLGGTLKVASRQGHGTRIILTVPHSGEQRGPTNT